MPETSNLRAQTLLISYRDIDGREFAALDVADLVFEPGRLTVVTGPSGCGKSSLLCGLSGLAESKNGIITYANQNILALKPAARDRFRRDKIGFVFQDFHLVRELAALENVLLSARFDHFFLPSDLVTRAKTLLAGLGVPERSTVSHLSRGEAQRVALARALLRDPPIILADEPTASLDTAAATSVIARLVALACEDGKVVVAVSHDPALIAAADRIIRLDHGRIVNSLERSAA